MKHDFELSFVTRNNDREEQQFEISYVPSDLPDCVRLTVTDYVGDMPSIICPLDAEALDLLIASLQMAKNRMQP